MTDTRPSILYKVTNTVNGKFYLGITSRSLSVRRAGHYGEMRSGSTTRFHNALRKYSRDCFRWEPLAVLCSQKEAAETEIRAISVFKPEYNIHAGGDLGGGGLPKSVRMRMNASKRKRVYCVTNDVTYSSCVAAARATRRHQTAIAMCCRGVIIHTNRYQYAFEKDYLAGKFDPLRKKRHNGLKKSVECVDTGEVFTSLFEAAAVHKTTTANIRMVCQGKRRVAGGMQFRYVGGAVEICRPTLKRAKLSADDVLVIRSLIGKVPRQEIADQYGISDGSVGDIYRRKSWKGI